MHGTVVDASSAASGGRPDAVRGFDHVDLWQAIGLEEKSVRNSRGRKVRQELCARTREGLQPQVDVALALCRPSGVKDGAPCKRLGRV